MHGERSLALHCIEQHACTTNDRIEQDAQRSSRMQTQRSARMHRVRCMTMQQSACITIECTDARCMPIERSRRCNEHNAPEDNEPEILNEQSRQAKDKASESSQHPEVIKHRASCALTSHSGVVQYVTLRRVGHSAHNHIRVSFSSFQRPE